MGKLEKYRHFFLYAKGWYKRTDNIFRDLGVIISDMYIMSYNKSDFELKHDVCRRLLIIIEEKNLLNHNGNDLSSFINGIYEKNTWECGYIHKTSPIIDHRDQKYKDLLEYDYVTAVVMKCLSIMRLSGKDVWGELGEIDGNIQRKISTLGNIEELKKSERI